MNSPHVVLLDNHDSFVYNLVDALAGYRTTVYRNSVSVAEVLAAEPDIIVLSPGPGHPRDAGCMMELIDATLGTIPILGVCLGFQALLDYHGGGVGPCGPVHGKSMPMTLTDAGAAHPVFAGLATDADPAQPGVPGTQVPVARYHSLGCTHVPAGMRVLAETEAEIGTIAMAAETDDGMALGMQFHPESILSPRGPDMLDRCIHRLSTHPTTELKH
ncbi:anthranilate synthase component II [Corynebacterium accolens]|uniref:anthranilate synthase component II n=1 Tax=Corynebacterium accolens TaxID=38284 RepID=UPI002543AE06|nr:anthranilate synthase component II [Corynebacterium accolens]MDK4275580.1 anthranilate synthase component II [Corynebacterium accolens]WKS55570.1 anthranilate synthase component II [Corynebacterium accolens]WKS68266.1 anthranilate synthase component II [Corynebacterium accolens]WKS70603.1 anthranilate synthase component II [Corynebacterium accolens]WKS72931.1 anthranilate synthase component II [Corynebacterium accolens]